MAEDIRLSGLIAPTYYGVCNDIMAGGHTYYDLYGGRGSGKSSFAAVMIILGMIQDKAANAMVIRKYGNTLRMSVYDQLVWALDMLGVTNEWRCTTTPMQMIYKRTGQTIMFRGLDKAEKLKSVKTARGYIKYLWIEELDEIAGPEEVRSVQQSVLRGGPSYVVFKTFNPPVSASNWANAYVMEPRPDALRHKSCYTDIDPSWLGDQFLTDAEELRRVNPRAYDHEYLGIPTGYGGEVFDNLDIREIPQSERCAMDHIYMGIDWGWYPDPYHWSKMHYDAGRQTLYILDEYRATRESNQETWDNLQTIKGVTADDIITADSAEPKSVADYRSYGASCRGAIKGPDSVRYGIKWLQSLRSIVIDPVTCPHTAREFSAYEYERTNDGEVISAYPDADNHSIDSVRYAMERVWRRKGQ